MLVLFAGAFTPVSAQRYYIKVNERVPPCGAPPCTGMVHFNFNSVNWADPNGNVNSQLVIEAATPPTTYTYSFRASCGPPFCDYASSYSGTMPSMYNGTGTLARGTFTYCYEPAMPDLQISTDGENYVLNMGVWGYSYTWEVKRGAEQPRLLTTVNNGTDPLQSSSVTVTPAMLQTLYNESPYGKNFAFRVTIFGCSSRTSALSTAVTFIEPKPVVNVVDATKAICFEGSTGTVTLSIASQTVNDFYINCSNKSTGTLLRVPDPQTLNTQPVHRGNYTIQGLDAGDWEFTVVNISSTVANTMVTKTVEQNPKVTVGFSATPAVNNGYYIRCSGGTGDVTAIGNGGNGGYKDFAWNTGAATALLSGVPAGTYTVTLRDQYNCPGQGTVSLTSPTALSAAVSSPKAYNGYEVRCHDQANGSATVVSSGGVTPYTYVWSTGATTATTSGLGVGSYTVTVTDRNGCPAPGNVTLTAPVPIDFTIDPIQDLACAGDRTGILEAKPVQSTVIGAARYAWSTLETDATVYDKAAGTYTVTVSDGQGCSTTKSHTLVNPPGYTVSLASGADYNGSSIKCNGDSNGKLVSTVRNASNVVTTAQSYQWLKNDVVFADGAGLGTQEDLSKGTYKLIITYGAQCKAETQYQLNDPDALAVTTAAPTPYSGQAISCYNATDATVRATVSGGTSPYAYQWNTGASTAQVPGVGAGTYTVSVADANSCPATSSISLANPAQVIASIIDVSDYSGYGVSCASSTNGTMRAVGLGGTGLYTYRWSNGPTSAINGALGGGVYTVKVLDQNNCAAEASKPIVVPPVLTVGVDSYSDISCNGGSDGVIRLLPGGGVGNYTYTRDNGTTWGTDEAFTGLPIGTYTLRVRDGNNCEAVATQALTQPTALGLTFTGVAPAFCADPRGEATAVVTGGVMEYSYSWKNASGAEVGTAAHLSNVRGGVYSVTVHDAHGCVISNTVGITSTDGAKATYTSVSALCHDSSDGSATLTITEGDGPFGIEWPDGQLGLQGNALKGGDHLVVITDGHDCSVIEQVTVPAPPALALTVVSSTAPTCYGHCDGALTLAASGGVGTYQFAWNGQHSNAQNNLCKGTYGVVLTDNNGCILNQPVTLAEPDLLTVNLDRATPATCKDGCDGGLAVLASGGNGGYTYSWDGGSTNAIRTNLCPDDYGVMVTDAKGCVGSNIVTLANTPAVAIDLGGGVTLCVGQTHTLDAGAGWANVQWNGSNGLVASSRTLNVKDAGSYWLEVLDAKGCVGQDTFLLATSYDLLKASFMIPKEAVVGDTVVMVDVSWPLPEVVQWDFPLAMKRVSGSDDVVFGQFNATGTYGVGLTARLGECVDYIEKQIAVVGGGVSDPGGRLGYEAYVKTFAVFSNPNDGAFDVNVELASADDVMLSIWGAQTGRLIGKFPGKGSSSYRVQVDLRPLSTGTYVIRLDHKRGTRYVRFIVR